MTKQEQNNGVWGVGEVWNDSLAEKKSREYEPRDHLWASELGKSPIDVWLKLKGERPTNPPNARARRKFVAGNIWEWLVDLIFKRAGILIGRQEWVSYQYNGLLKVTGYLDQLAGGKPNFEKTKLEEIGLPEKLIKAGENIVEYLKKKYPEGLEERIIETKSSSSFMFDKIDREGKPSSNHELQLFHYLKAKDMKKGSILYICKDDCRMIEIPVFNCQKVEKKYKNAIETISRYYQEDKKPPLEKLIVFDEDSLRFSKNWKVEYSGYLEKLYGFKKPKDFYEKYGSMAKKWNYVLNRIKKGKDMTDHNKLRLAEMREMGFNVKEIKKLIS